MTVLVYEDEMWTIKRYGPFIYEISETYSGTVLMTIDIALYHFDTKKDQDELVKEIVKNLKL